MKLVFFIVLFISVQSYSLTDEKTYIETINKAGAFLNWLEQHKAEFASCQPKKDGSTIVLCDGTAVDAKELRSLFQMKPAVLIEFIKNKNIKLEIYCKEDRKNTFKNWCSVNTNRKFLKEVTSLHGQYLPNENTIALHSDSNLGSLVHEYLHYLQYQNNNKVFDRVYKKERVQIQNEIVTSFDNLISDIQTLEKDRKINEAKALLKYATQFSDLLMKFGLWQKLIDERNLFLVFINYSKDLSIKKLDIELAKKNMTFLCRDKEISSLLNKKDCL